MNFKIHRGTQEIGGSCVEVWTEKTRILLDFGMPLVDRDGSGFDYSKYKNLPVRELIAKGVLPDVEGIYKGSDELIDGILISHPHQDHYGFVGYLDENLKYYIGQAAFQIINTANLFIRKDQLFKNHSFFKRSEPFSIGDLKITPYWMDHSAFDSYAFHIESNGKSIFYSGDFRGHGRKTNAYKWFLDHAPQGIDYLLLEGTMIGRSAKKEKTEDELQADFETLLREDKLNLVYTSGQNIDRLVTIYKACNATNKVFVIDPYIASMLLESSRFAKIQHPSRQFKNIKVFFPRSLTSRMKHSKNGKLVFRFKRHIITLPEINSDPGKYVMCIRPSLKAELEQMPAINGGNLIYSLWKGYLKQKYTKDFVDYLKTRAFTLHHIHTSGHADIPTLKEFVNAIKPKNIVPIHTFAGDRYKDLFTCSVVEMKDGEEKGV